LGEYRIGPMGGQGEKMKKKEWRRKSKDLGLGSDGE
jgi:hypothetical protein